MVRRLLSVAGPLALAVFARATVPVGSWTGRFIVKRPVFPAGYPAAERAKLAARIAAVEKVRMHLVLKADRTYSMHNVGLPVYGKPFTGGTWTQTGAKVQLLQKGGGASHQGALTLDPSGRRMSLTMGNGQAQVVFVRA